MALVQKAYADLITHTRAGSAMRYNAVGTLETVAANQPRFDYDPLSLQLRGLLIEGQRTNLILHNTEFNDVLWAKNRCATTPDVTASPDGTQTADLVARSDETTSDWYVSQRGQIDAGTTYCSSVFFKPSPGATSAIAVYLHTTGFTNNIAVAWDRKADAPVVISGVPTAYGMEKLANGWRRLWVSGVATTTTLSGYASLCWSRSGAVGTFAAAADPLGEGYYLWGAQLEVGEYPSSPILTTTAQVTRPADLVAVNTVAPWFNPLAGTLLLDCVGRHAAPGTAFGLSLGIDNKNYIGLAYNAAGKAVQSAFVRTAGDGPVLGGGYGDATLRQALAWDGTLVAHSVNGGAVVTAQPPANGYPTIASLRIGHSHYTNTVVPMHVRAVNYYPRRLSNAEIQALTA